MHIHTIFGVSLAWVIALPFLACIAGFFDAIAGGGSLLTIPVLLLTGLDPVTAIATNKFQGMFGAAAASIKFTRAKLIDFRAIAPMLVMAIIGAILGALIVQHISTYRLMQAVPIMLISIALYLLLVKNFGASENKPKLSQLTFCLTVPLGIGLWDGIMGPATGSLFALAFTVLLGKTLLKATAHAKFLNLTTNLSAVLVFTLSGHILWLLGFLMAFGVFIGGWLGAHAAIRVGSGLIRWLLVIISVAMSLRLAWQYW